MKVIKWLAISLAVIIGLPLGALVAFGFVAYWSSHGTGIDGGIGSWAIRSWFDHNPLYFELTAKLEVEGENVEFTKVVDCQPYFDHYDIHYFLKKFYMPNALMTHRLSDGSGVMLVIPDICVPPRYPKATDKPYTVELPEDLVPLVLWTQDAENPEVIEAYFSFESMSRPQARVRFKSISLRNDPSLHTVREVPQFLTLPRKPNLLEHRRVWPGELQTYTGSYLISIRHGDWSKETELRQALEAKTTSGFLSHEVARMIRLNGRISGFLQPIDAGHAKFVYMRQRKNYSSEPSPRSGFLFPILDRIRGFGQTERGFETAPQYDGVVTFILASKGAENSAQPYSPLVSNLDGRNIDWSKDAQLRHYFDVKSGTIFTLVDTKILLSKDSNNHEAER